ncbi:quinone oxidoreductase [Aestuariivirga litoralis]|uniref:Quinone oxidoreductase n=1 Tax=Aestuariivirga litoralis TaxID=2650924 RepID=A0A2W2B7L8_9HYPH|nr:quinone oxidoreductase [Aestuariivirga litoralis]PZF76264.1 quinone oxidoreductase [Aestuariivirga litoralis]
MKAIRIETTGGPEVMKLVDAEVGKPGAGQVRVRQTAIGLNYIDTYHRTGLYPVPLPSGLGLEAAGVVEELGEGVTSLKPGDRIAYGTGPIGAYADMRNLPANRLVKLPDAISDETAAGMMLKGMTARYLLRATYVVKPGDTILLHAAAGGVGLIMSQWAKALGATVIGTVGSDAKAEIARAHGCDHVINYSTEDTVKRLRELTNGKGVPVVYDGVGKDTLMVSLDCLSPRGMFVSFGNASGPVPPLDMLLLSAKGSLYATRPTLMAYTASDADLQDTARDLVDIVASGKVKIPVNQRYALADVVQAHRDLESRKTTGTTVLTP